MAGSPSLSCSITPGWWKIRSAWRGAAKCWKPLFDNRRARFALIDMAIGGERKWDAFAAECGVSLLRQESRRSARPNARGRRHHVISLQYHRPHNGSGVPAPRRWAGLRPPYARATRPRLETQLDAWRARKNALAQEFIERRLPAEYPDFDAINATALAEVEAVHAEQFPELTPLRRSQRAPRRSGRSREKFYPDTLSLDTHVIMTAFGWLDLRSARSVDERRKWLGFVKELLRIVLGLIPPIDVPPQQEIDGLPSDFDSWVWGVVARTIPCVSAEEDAPALWQPILDLGFPAHRWVERFFWYWFSDGLRAATSPQDFANLWSAMLVHALESPNWNPSINRSYDLDGMVFQLLGFNSHMHTLAQSAGFATAIGQMKSLFARAAERWFGMPRL